MTTAQNSAPSNGSPSESKLRAVVLLDNQNMYKGAREAFGWEEHAGRFGNFRPYGFGRQMVRDPSRMLKQVRIYTGVPTPKNDPIGNAATQRRIAAWVAENPEKIQVFPRPLKYPPRQGREKGVDVELAIDFVRLALDDEFDVGVMASCDTDLVPALAFVADRCPDKTLVTVGWEALPGCEVNTAEPLDLPSGGLTRVKLTKADFDRIADKRDFRQSTVVPEDVVDQSRWDKIKARFQG